MCEDNDYGQLLEEYRGMIESLFHSVLDRLLNTERELHKYRMREQEIELNREMEKMMQAKGGY